MKRYCLLLLCNIIIINSFAQNVGIGTATPITKLHVVSTLQNVATFNGGSGMWITLAENGVNRGYIGSFAGNAEDVDFGTYSGNATGKIHFVTIGTPRLSVLPNGNIGIGTTTPLSLLHATNGAVLFNGSTGNTPVSGAGVRMMWIPSKQAFRAGEVTGTQWDDANIGSNSIAVGVDAIASGISSTAIGISTSASGDFSTAMGFNTSATGFISTVMGGFTSASATYSNAMGYSNKSKSYAGTVVGAYNDSANAANPTDFNPLNRIFQIGNGTADNARNNAMTVLQNGKVGIGMPVPGQQLDVNGAIRLGYTTAGLSGSIRFNANKFEGHDGNNWTSFDQLPTGTIVSSLIYPDTELQNKGYRFISTLQGMGVEQPVTGVAADSWLSTATFNTVTPGIRDNHTAIWTGIEMIIWGGNKGSASYDVINTGAKYNPVTNTWTPISINNAPSAREEHTAIWTGTEMIVWGGRTGANNFLSTGAKYNPITDTWTPVSPTNAPSARYSHTAIWTGTEMIVWGGYDGSSLNTGAKYNPITDTWTPVSPTNAPSARYSHTAIWTGTEMIVWGGYDGSSLNTGAKYNPATNTWVATSPTNAPLARSLHTAIWTGTEMIVWGGALGSNYLFSGGRYNPVTDSWVNTSNTNVPLERNNHTAIWTGSEMIIWGGYYSNIGGSMVLNTGGKYNPLTNAWIATSIINALPVRKSHTAIWTGNQMIIFGGNTNASGTAVTQTGGRYFTTALPAYNTFIEIEGSIYLYSKQ